MIFARFTCLLSVVLFFTACSGSVVDDVARSSAKAVITPIIAKKFPFLNSAEITDCIIDNANASEVIKIGAAAISGVTKETISTVFEITTRPETLKCITKVSLLGG